MVVARTAVLHQTVLAVLAEAVVVEVLELRTLQTKVPAELVDSSAAAVAVTLTKALVVLAVSAVAVAVAAELTLGTIQVAELAEAATSH